VSTPLRRAAPAAILALALGASCFSARRLIAQLPLARPGNWILVVGPDSPFADVSGVERVDLGGDHLETVGTIAEAVLGTPSVRGTVYLAAELEFLDEATSPGIGVRRADLHAALSGFPREDVHQVPREEILARVEEVASTRRVAVIETDARELTDVVFALDVPEREPAAEPRPGGAP
jgi:hypothetical protein